ncbi:DUF3221 domain-containing protein [Bacillus sp. RG28]|uniref:DUF3221 domain-containing protein n=1 Tax=Gottfriedia endophytica TaxID=2820819 RepID=A0A940SJW1_9BACI|nr:DUF3221 domain-containing protein [Gottfriedia endophytica]MBP0724638.1 DUF3221 domain-containing protein [Gottfriedia endophytica]
MVKKIIVPSALIFTLFTTRSAFALANPHGISKQKQVSASEKLTEKFTGYIISKENGSLSVVKEIGKDEDSLVVHSYSSKDQLKIGDKVNVYYGPTTRSLPAQTVGKVNIEKVKKDNYLAMNTKYKGFIVSKNWNGTGSLLVEKEIGKYEDSLVTHTYSSKSELKIGDKVNVYYNGTTTLSIPPQTGDGIIEKLTYQNKSK